MTQNEWEKLPCPHCGKKAVRWDFAAERLRCQSCHLSGFSMEQTEKMTPPPAPPSKQLDEPKALTNAQIEAQSKRANIAAQVTETYLHDDGEGEIGSVTVTRIIPVVPDDKIPDLAVDINTARFTRWRLQETIQQEKRWGRDNLRSRGFEVVDKIRDPETDRQIKVMARPGEEHLQGSGRLAVGQAIAAVKRHIEKTKGDN